MNEDTDRLRKLVSVLCQAQMIVALDQVLENRFPRVANHRLRAAAHLLGAITALLKLKQQVQHLYPDWEGLLRWEDDTGT